MELLAGHAQMGQVEPCMTGTAVVREIDKIIADSALGARKQYGSATREGSAHDHVQSAGAGSRPAVPAGGNHTKC